MKTFSLIGTGFIFPSHAQAIRDIGGTICDVVNDERGDNTWREMVKTTRADYVVILAPNDLHCEMALAAAELGKTVLCEKPLCILTKDARMLMEHPNIFAVHQLRHHPAAAQLKRDLDLSRHHTIEMDISVYRDPHYYESWKGKRERSGGVLFNLGVHYFDMLLHLFGKPERVETTFLDDKTGEGVIEGPMYSCRWRVSTGATKESARRVFSIDGVLHNFSSKENLAFENLHRFVYEDLLQGRGVTPKDALPSLELIEQLSSMPA